MPYQTFKRPYKSHKRAIQDHTRLGYAKSNEAAHGKNTRPKQFDHTRLQKAIFFFIARFLFPFTTFVRFATFLNVILRQQERQQQSFF